MAAVRFGIGTRDITPAWPVMLHGYAARNRLAGISPDDAVGEPLQCTALCLDGKAPGGRGRSRLVVLTLDMIGVGAAEVEVIRSDIARACGVSREELLVAASHTHFAPCISPQLFDWPMGLVEPDPRYLALVRRAIVEAVTQGCSELEAGDLQYYRVNVPSVLFNRRMLLRGPGPTRTAVTNFLYPEDPAAYELAPSDPELTALRIVTARGPAAVLTNFGCHPVTGSGDRTRSHYSISADYPFYLRETIARAWGCPVLFTLGAAGDAVPLQRGGDARQRIGGALGNAVVLGERVFRGCAGAVGEAVIAHSDARLEARTILETRGTAALEAYEAARPGPGEAGSKEPDAEAVGRYRSAALRAFRARLYPEDRFTVEAAIHRIGDVVLVAWPFEVLSETALRLKKAHPNAVLVSVADGYQGYLPHAHEYERGGYEATAESTHLVPGTADRMLDLVLEKLEAIDEFAGQ